MKDQDYIKAGVELADGFTERQFLYEYQVAITSRKKRFLAALAAQLTEQVDDLDHRGKRIIAVISEKNMTRIWSDKTGECLSESRGRCRAMNDIKAVVDSKVLK